MSGVRRIRLANDESILQDGPKSKTIIMDIKNDDPANKFTKTHERKSLGGDVKAPRKTNVLTLKITNSENEGYMRNTPPPISNERPSRGEGPSQNYNAGGR